jgi:hypothetical protein
MKTFLTFILITGFCFAEEPAPKPLPKDVQTIVDSREADLQAARIAFDKAVFEANKKAIVKMEAVVKTSTQKGDLDGALASKKFVEDWNKEKEAVAVSSGMGGAGPVEKKEISIIGKWEWFDGKIHSFEKGGTINSRFQDTWSLEKDGSIRILWNGKKLNTVTFIDKDTLLLPWNGTEYKIKRNIK